MISTPRAPAASWSSWDGRRSSAGVTRNPAIHLNWRGLPAAASIEVVPRLVFGSLGRKEAMAAPGDIFKEADDIPLLINAIVTGQTNSRDVKRCVLSVSQNKAMGPPVRRRVTAHNLSTR